MGKGGESVRVAALDKAARRLADARKELDQSTHGARLAAIAAAEFGLAETRIAQTLGVARTTVREWLARERVTR
jgi:predicted transcriptional regulator